MHKAALLLILLFLFSYATEGREITVATYNIRYDNAEDSGSGNGWRQRCLAIADIIRFQDFDIFGTQEGYRHQLQDLKGRLPGYSYTGVGRDDGKEAGEHAAIFYKHARFQLISKGDFWLSDTTNRPNKGWDAALPRICSWGKFREIKTGFVFYFFNLHMDHKGLVARTESAKLIVDTIRKMAGNIPAILTGDFNLDQYHESYRLIQGSQLLKDACTMTDAVYAHNGTFNNFDINRYCDSRIDHIFLSRAFTVQRYGILNSPYYVPESAAIGRGAAVKCLPKLPSDHFPVMARLEY